MERVILQAILSPVGSGDCPMDIARPSDVAHWSLPEPLEFSSQARSGKFMFRIWRLLLQGPLVPVLSPAFPSVFISLVILPYDLLLLEPNPGHWMGSSPCLLHAVGSFTLPSPRPVRFVLVPDCFCH